MAKKTAYDAIISGQARQEPDWMRELYNQNGASTDRFADLLSPKYYPMVAIPLLMAVAVLFWG